MGSEHLVDSTIRFGYFLAYLIKIFAGLFTLLGEIRNKVYMGQLMHADTIANIIGMDISAPLTLKPQLVLSQTLDCRTLIKQP